MSDNIKIPHDFRRSLVIRLMVYIGIVLILTVAFLTFYHVISQNSIILDGASTDLENLKDITNRAITVSVLVFVVSFLIVIFFLLRLVEHPLKNLLRTTNRIQRGEYHSDVETTDGDEMGRLGLAIKKLGKQIQEKQSELSRQRDEYQNLFEQVPCLITVQDRNYRLLQYNSEFAESFDPEQGDFCFHAYKGREEKCVNCPVEKTFEDGLSHYGEETGINKDGSTTHWILRTTPIKDNSGKIVAAMEMSVDITQVKQLEEMLRKSEIKYQEIFNNIPNPVFVLDAHTLKIIDCNQSVSTVYGYSKKEIIKKSFLDLMEDKDNDVNAEKIKKSTVINRIRQVNKSGETLFVDIWLSPSEYPDRDILLAVTNDITQRLETEQQLIQASKMTTLGEMATGVAHELNQPLSVIKTTSSWFLKKIKQNEPIEDELLATMLNKVDSNVDRAAKIINHMRQFARKSYIKLEKVQMNDIIESAFEIFSQQLKLRGIEIVWETEKALPKINADPGRLEQVFINLLLNARDAIEEKWSSEDAAIGEKKITLKTYIDNGKVVCEVQDTGKGIPPALANKIFEPFFTTKEIGKGTGLGLSISYGIVKECGGNIYVDSGKGQGACFILEFPVQNPNED